MFPGGLPGATLDPNSRLVVGKDTCDGIDGTLRLHKEGDLCTRGRTKAVTKGKEVIMRLEEIIMVVILDQVASNRIFRGDRIEDLVGGGGRPVTSHE